MNRNKHSEKHLENAIQYYRNAREELRQVPIEDGFYADKKHLRRAAGVCWLAVVEAAIGFLLKRGVDRKQLRSTDAFRSLLSEYAEIDGKFFRYYESALHMVHIDIYYWGQDRVAVVKDGFEVAKFVIERLTGMKL
jgi:hypothetical protein